MNRSSKADIEPLPISSYQTLFDAAPGLYLVLDPLLRIVAVNDAYLTATRTRREDILTKGIFDVFPDNPDDPAAEGVRNLRASLHRVLQTREADAMPVQRYDIRNPEDEGGRFEARYWSPLNKPVFSSDGSLAYIIHRVEDVTEFVRLKQQGIEDGRLNDTLRQQALRMETEIFARANEVAEASAKLKSANEELERLYLKTKEIDELKTRFFSNVSHELRTPLTLILGPVDRILASLDRDAPFRWDLQTVQRNARMLHQQVDNLLDLARLDAGRMHVTYGRFDLAKLIRVLASLFDSVGRDRRIDYRIQAPAQALIDADVDKCERIAINLISNAFKFTPDGGVVSVTLSEEDDELVLEVADSGPGIPEEEREVVFERFRQLEGPNEQRVGGSGLGLSIVREFTNLQRGNVSATASTLGGASFLVRLPRAAPPGTVVADVAPTTDVARHVAHAREPLTTTAIPPTAVTGAAPLVLVIEDNPDMSAFIADALSTHFRVASASDGRSGLKLALDLRPALILTDAMLPELTGDQVISALRQHSEFDETPIVMLTARADETFRTRMLQAGAQDFLQKPFLMEELVARLTGLMRERTRIGKRIRNLEERFQATFEQAAVGIAHVAPDGRWLRVNRKLCEIVGYRADELLTRTFQEITHPDDLNTDIEVVKSMLVGNIDNYTLEKRYIRKDGSLVWIQLTVSLVRADDDSPEYFISVVEDISRRKSAELALIESEERFRVIAATISEVIWFLDINPRRYAYVSPAYESVWKRPCADLYDNPILSMETVHETDRARVRQVRLDAKQANRSFELEYRIVRPDGSVRWIKEQSKPVTSDGRTSGQYVGIASDITDDRLAAEKLQLAATVFESAREAIIITDLDGRVLAANQAFADMLGYSGAEIVGKKTSVLRSREQDADTFRSLWASLERSGQWQGELRNRHKSGETLLCRVTISSALNAEQQRWRYVALISDISQVRRNEEEIARLAHYDPLTDLPNRLLLQSRLEHSLARAKRSRSRVAVLSVNLDDFQKINDSMGHRMGDQLLREVASRLKPHVRHEDSFGRFGGDQFLLILELAADPKGAASVAHVILAALTEPFRLDPDVEAYVSASVGISVSPEDGRTANELLRNADTALHQAKAQGRNCFRFYMADMNVEAVKKLELDGALRKAVERQEFVLFYQPKVDLRTGRTSGAEALIRWPRSDGSLTPPGQFIPHAEMSGHIVQIGTWAIQQACRQLMDWHSHGFSDCRVAVNVSARQFHSDDLVEIVSAALCLYNVPPECLELELTESMLMSDPERTANTLRGLKRLGVYLSLDDFGTGYSSLGYLGRFPIDALKIDQSFVREITSEQQSAVIATAIIELAHRLGIKVIGEGVETESQVDYLKRHGCDEVQGYYYSKPVPAAEFFKKCFRGDEA